MTGTPSPVRLAGYATVWSKPDFTTGEWDARGYCYSDEVQSFVRACHEDGLVLGGFDWVTWKATQEAQALLDPAAIRGGATLMQLAQLLTVAIRQDRFVEGGLAGWFEAGLIQAICDRAIRLAA